MSLGDRREAGTHLEVGELSESLFAARMWALVGSVTCVDSAKGSLMRGRSQTHTPRPALGPKPLAGLGHTSAPKTHGPLDPLSSVATSEPRELRTSEATVSPALSSFHCQSDQSFPLPLGPSAPSLPKHPLRDQSSLQLSTGACSDFLCPLCHRGDHTVKGTDLPSHLASFPRRRSSPLNRLLASISRPLSMSGTRPRW